MIAKEATWQQRVSSRYYTRYGWLLEVRLYRRRKLGRRQSWSERHEGEQLIIDWDGMWPAVKEEEHGGGWVAERGRAGTAGCERRGCGGEAGSTAMPARGGAAVAGGGAGEGVCCAASTGANKDACQPQPALAPTTRHSSPLLSSSCPPPSVPPSAQRGPQLPAPPSPVHPSVSPADNVRSLSPIPPDDAQLQQSDPPPAAAATAAAAPPAIPAPPAPPAARPTPRLYRPKQAMAAADAAV
jgi:hypothetical protein